MVPWEATGRKLREKLPSRAGDVRPETNTNPLLSSRLYVRCVGENGRPVVRLKTTPKPRLGNKTKIKTLLIEVLGLANMVGFLFGGGYLGRCLGGRRSDCRACKDCDVSRVYRAVVGSSLHYCLY